VTKATADDLREILSKKLAKPKILSSPKPSNIKSSLRKIELNREETYANDPDGTAIEFPSPLHMLAILQPDLDPYPWQAETLLQLAGYANPYNLSTKSPYTPEQPFLLCLPAANGSGKDLVIIAAFAVWFALKGLRNFVFITSSSYEQIKTQTNPHIRDLCNAANKKLGPIFRSVENYHVCTQTASEIKLYVTDEKGRAEGYHPRFGGQMAMIFNEAKTIDEDLWSAYARCTGYSYWLEVSSPGGKSGHFYDSSRDSISHPLPPLPGKYYLRHVTAYDCPHIPRAHIELQQTKQSKEWFDSSVLALFTDYGQTNVVKLDTWQTAARYPITEKPTDTYAIGGDLAAGGDENSFYLRKGPIVIDELHFRQVDTTLTAEIFDTKFNYVKNEPGIVVRMDDGGVGHAIIDTLTKMGWNVQRVHNQSAAVNKREFLNRGAEMYFHLSRLLKDHLIKSHGNRDTKLRDQITSRIADNRDGGKFRLEKKEDHRARTHNSPDRADAYVLTFSSFPVRLRKDNQPEPQPTNMSLDEFEEDFTWGGLTRINKYDHSKPSYIRRI
jgi:phage terminase large subunit